MSFRQETRTESGLNGDSLLEEVGSRGHEAHARHWKVPALCATKLSRFWVSQALRGLGRGGDVGLRADDVGKPREGFRHRKTGSDLHFGKTPLDTIGKEAGDGGRDGWGLRGAA